MRGGSNAHARTAPVAPLLYDQGCSDNANRPILIVAYLRGHIGVHALQACFQQCRH
jgi:hypothetical protein